MAETLLITMADLQDEQRTGLNGNVESRKVTPWIIVAQRRLERIMGRTGYALLKAAKESDPTLADMGNATWKALMDDYLTGFMCWLTVHLAYASMYAEADRGGVFTKSGEDFHSVTRDELALLMNTSRTAYESEQARAIEYLTDNPVLFPWYTQEVTGEERITSTARAGISFRRSAAQSNDRG